MLRGISPFMNPELLSVLYRMGHGDEIVLADAHFPAETLGKRVIRADGIRIPDLLRAILPLWVLVDFVDDPLLMMEPVQGDELDESVEDSYRIVIKSFFPEAPAIQRLERFKFYERSKGAFAVVQSGDIAKYGNIILKKGVL